MLLTKQQIDAKCKKLNLTIKEKNHTLVATPIFSDKLFQEYKQEVLGYYRQREEDNRLHHNRMYPGERYIPKGIPSDEVLKKEYFENEKEKEFPNHIGFNTDQSTFSCAVNEIGGFNQFKGLDKHWHLLLRNYVLGSKKNYFKCSVKNRKRYQPIIDGLKKAGFTHRADEKSNHGRYTVGVWDFVKK